MRRLQVTALKEGRIRKPVVAWVSGTCAKLFKSEVQFGHAGAKSGGQAESAQVTSHIMPGTLCSSHAVKSHRMGQCRCYGLCMRQLTVLAVLKLPSDGMSS